MEEAKLTTSNLEKLEELRQLNRSGRSSIIEQLQQRILGEWNRTEGTKFALNSDFDKAREKLKKLEPAVKLNEDRINIL